MMMKNYIEIILIHVIFILLLMIEMRTNFDNFNS